MRNNNVTIHGINDTIAYCEAVGLAKVFLAYAENASGETIEAVGFNPNSGYVYIALENGVSICSMLGHDVEYLITNPYDGDELFFDSYAEAMNHDWEEEEEEEEEEACSDDANPCTASLATGTILQHCQHIVDAWLHEQKVKLEELDK